MSYALIYLLKSTTYLALFYGFFLVMMRSTTFFRLNRIMLLLGTFVCMLLPLYTVTIEKTESIQLPLEVMEELLILKPSIKGETDITLNESFLQQESTIPSSFPFILFGIYGLGTIIYLAMVIRSYTAIGKIINSYPKQWEDGCWTIIVPYKTPSFSWCNYIVISEEDYQRYPQIMVHEKMHYLCHHSYDMLFMTIINAIHWFNPIVWLIRTELKQLHEFEADAGVINQGIDATQYQLLLVRKAVGKKLYTIANGFNHTKLKKRITMMIQERSNGWERLKWFVSVPVVMSAMLVFAQPEVKNQLEEIIPPEVKQEEPKEWESLRTFFIEKSNTYRKYLIERGNDVKNDKDKRLTYFMINQRNQVMTSDCYHTSNILKSTTEIRPYLVKIMQEARTKRTKELGKDEVRGIVFQHDIAAHPDSLYNCLEQIKLAYEDLRKEFPNDENLDKVCPMWVHFQTPRYFSRKKEQLSGKTSITIYDGKTGSFLGEVKNIKFLDRLRATLNMIPNGTELAISLKTEKGTSHDEINEIKNALNGFYQSNIKAGNN